MHRKVAVLDTMSEKRLSIHLVLPAALSREVYSVSNRNEYQNQKNNVSGEQSTGGS
jgi:hypothetical protein